MLESMLDRLNLAERGLLDGDQIVRPPSLLLKFKRVIMSCREMCGDINLRAA
jgi:hypothetical protein